MWSVATLLNTRVYSNFVTSGYWFDVLCVTTTDTEQEILHAALLHSITHLLALDNKLLKKKLIFYTGLPRLSNSVYQGQND